MGDTGPRSYPNPLLHLYPRRLRLEYAVHGRLPGAGRFSESLAGGIALGAGRLVAGTEQFPPGRVG